MSCTDVQGGLDHRCKTDLEDVLQWLRSLHSHHPPRTALIIFDNVENAIAERSKAQVTPRTAAAADRVLAISRSGVVRSGFARQCSASQAASPLLRSCTANQAMSEMRGSP